MLVYDLATAQHTEHLLHITGLMALRLMLLWSMDNTATLIEILQLELFFQVLVGFLSLDFSQDGFFYTDLFSVLDLLSKGYLFYISLKFLFVIRISHLVNIILEKLFFKNLKYYRQHCLSFNTSIGNLP
jgi:hypothetical protein